MAGPLEVIIDGVRYAPALDVETWDVAEAANRLWGGVAGRGVRVALSRGNATQTFEDSALSAPQPRVVMSDVAGTFPQIWTNAPSVWLALIDEEGIVQQNIEVLAPHRALTAPQPAEASR